MRSLMIEKNVQGEDKVSKGDTNMKEVHNKGELENPDTKMILKSQKMPKEISPLPTRKLKVKKNVNSKHQLRLKKRSRKETLPNQRN
ncbi:hypothetical protein Lal_00037683 [Lupinus albus]|nr:hypothetical protein Lal_00037683 [Lupinus albus]